MEHKMQKAKREVTEDVALSYLDKAEYGTLALVDIDGEPYSLPISFARAGRQLIFHGSMRGGHKLSCIKHDARASFSAVAKTGLDSAGFTTAFESAICFGKIRILDNEATKHKALRALIDKYSPDFIKEGEAYIERAARATQVFILDIERISGKCHE